MADHPNLRSIAVIRRITGVRAGRRPRLAVLRQWRSSPDARLTAIVRRTGLAHRVARHALGFGQSLWPQHARRFMSGPGVGLIFRRRIRRQPRPPARRTPVWPRSHLSSDPWSDAWSAGEDVSSFDVEPVAPDAFTMADDGGGELDALASEPLAAESPASALLNRHEAFLGLSLRQPAARSAIAASRGMESPPLNLPLSRRAVAPTLSPAEPDAMPAGQLFPAMAPPTGRRSGPALGGVSGVAPVQAVISPPLVDDRAPAVAGSAPAAAAAGGLRAGLHSLRLLPTVQPMAAGARGPSLSTAVAAKHTLATLGSAGEEIRAHRSAPVTLPLTRPFTVARAQAILRATGLSSPVVQARWPESPASPVPIGDQPSTWGMAQAGIGTAGTGQFSAGAFGPMTIGRAASSSTIAATSPATGFMAAVAPSPRAEVRAEEDPAVAYLAGVAGSGPYPALPADRHGPMSVRRRDVVHPAGWSVAQRLAGGATPFAHGIRQMHATAAELVVRRPPGIAARAFQREQAVRLLQWPVGTRAAERDAGQAPPVAHMPFPLDAFVDPTAGGELPAAVGRARPAMRVQPFDATLAPQFPIGTLAAPAGTTSDPALAALIRGGGAADVASRAVVSGLGPEDVGGGAVPAELLPAFAAQRARHATWGDQLTLGSPPPLLAVAPTGEPAVRPARPMAGVRDRLAFAAGRTAAERARARADQAQASAGGGGNRLPLGPGLGGLLSAARGRTGGVGEVAQSGLQWPASFPLTSAAVPSGAAAGGASVGTAESTAGGVTSGSWGPWRDMREAFGVPTAGVSRQIRHEAGMPSSAAADRRFDANVLMSGDLSGSLARPTSWGGWPATATRLLLRQRPAWEQMTRAAGGSPFTAGPISAPWGSRPAAEGGPVARWPGRAATGDGDEAARTPGRPKASIWTPAAALPVVRGWRRPAPDAMTAPAPPLLRWPVYRSPLPDVAEPGAAQRSAAAEAMAASDGQPLPPLVRRSMEHLFRMDLASVRVHTGAPAARATGAVAARAMAHGTDVYLPGGMADSPRGEQMPLLAHELTHVAQHLGHRPPAAMPSLTLARRAAPQEQEADHIERLVADAVQDRSAVQDRAMVAREPAPDLTLARRSSPVTIMRVVEESDATVSRAIDGTAPAPGAAAPATGGAADKAKQQQETNKLAEEIFRRLEHRLTVERERGGHRW